MLPGRLERRAGEIRDGAHNPDGARWLLERLPRRDYTICVSILRDKDVDAMLACSPALGDTLVATRRPRTPARSPPPSSRARARRTSTASRPCDDPRAAVARAHELGEPVLVTGSLYLLADLDGAAEDGGAAHDGDEVERSARRVRLRARRRAAIVGIAFALGYILGKLLL